MMEKEKTGGGGRQGRRAEGGGGEKRASVLSRMEAKELSVAREVHAGSLRGV